MYNIVKIFLLITIQYVTYSENLTIRSNNINSKHSNYINSEPLSVVAKSFKKQSNINRSDLENKMEYETQEADEYPQYKFSYKVFDPTTGDIKEHEEKRDGELVQGEYSLVEPDGSTRIVTYVSNGTSGFTAIVTKIEAPKTEDFSKHQITENTSDYNAKSAEFLATKTEKEIPTDVEQVEKEKPSQMENVERKPEIIEEPIMWVVNNSELLLSEEMDEQLQPITLESRQPRGFQRIYTFAIPKANFIVSNSNKDSNRLREKSKSSANHKHPNTNIQNNKKAKKSILFI